MVKRSGSKYSERALTDLMRLANMNKSKRHGRKLSNRQQMPAVAKMVHEVRSVFGEVKVLYAEENGRSIGKEQGEVIPWK